MPEKSGQIQKARACPDLLARQARDYVNLLLKFRLRSVEEVRKKLAQRGFLGNIIDDVVGDFSRAGLLDDRRFAKIWVQDRLSLKPMGRLRMRLELKAKGLSDADIDDAISQTSKDIDEYELAKPIAVKRLRVLDNVDKLKRKKRVWDFLLRRGFTYDVIDRVVKEIIG
jgi:regulatory protein